MATDADRTQPLSTRRMVRPNAQRFYEDILRTLTNEAVPFVVGGALALKHFAGIARDTKDLDVFLRKGDVPRAMDVLANHGFETKVLFPHWLAKAWSGPHFVDFIFDSANGLCAVDDVFSWRAGLRRLEPLIARLPDSDESHALRAEVALQLGEIERARQIVAGIAPDHWRACGVRAGLYELDGDVERAESARVAALLLAPADGRAEPTARLEGLRRRHRRWPNPTQQLWERVR